MEYNTSLLIMTIVFSIITLFTGIAVFKKKKYNFLIVNIASYISYLIFLLVQYNLKFHVRAFIVCLVIITIIGNNLIGCCLNFYKSSKHYDRFLHALGSFSFSLFFYSILAKITVPTFYPKFFVSIFVAAIGISLGCILEICEFILDSTTNSKNQHGLKDTNFDLISNVIGAIIAGIFSMSIFF